jgi:hypothetical protein
MMPFEMSCMPSYKNVGMLYGKSGNLHGGDIKKAVGEITSYHERDYFFLVFVHVSYPSFGILFTFPFCFPCDGSSH